MASVVDGLQSHASSEGPIANHGHGFEGFTPPIPGQGHAEGGGNGGGGVARAEMVKTAFATLEVARHTTLLAEAVEILVTASQQFVGVGLVAHIPDHLVVVEVKGLIQGQGELHHPQAWSQVAAAGGHHLEVALAHLAGNGLEFCSAEAVQLIRMAQLAEMHAGPFCWGPI